ncbi:MAG: serpin family protein [Treponema sp.]|nr:serpin family protein [Treponema sp.]
MKRLIIFLFIFITTLNVFSAQEMTETPENLAEKSINSFDNKLYESLCNKDGNVNYSAISIYSLLYALQQGAQNQTQKQLNDVISFIPTPDFDNQMKDLITNTQNMSNSLWYKKTLNIQNEYKKFAKAYDFEIKPTDFYNAAKVKKDINSYISQKTDKLIENFLSENLPASTQLVLLNTLYFNQKWKTAFDEEGTREQTFYKTKTAKTKVQMMHNTLRLPYYEDDTFQIIELAYEDERYSMLVFLPKDYEYDFAKTNPNKLIEKYNSYRGSQRVQVSFPKFDLTTKYDLVPILQAMGMQDAFNPQAADFSKIFTDSNNIYVDAAIHQVRIIVNEKETKAAAVTMFGMKTTSARPERPIIFNADHPFCYVIRDNELGINLFTGIVREPK